MEINKFAQEFFIAYCVATRPYARTRNVYTSGGQQQRFLTNLF